MKWLLISDTHANLEALEAVLEAADFDRIAFLGDAVDYGPDPEPVVDALREAARTGGALVLGNHDEAVSTAPEDFDDSGWSPLASATVRYSRGRLSKSQTEFLGSLPRTATLDLGAAGRAILAHGTPASNREYLWPDLPEGKFRSLIEDDTREFTHLFVGHSHLPFKRPLGRLTVVNPGSVGQPRDGDPRAGFALFDTGEGRLTFHRVSYAVTKTAAKVRGRGMPHAAELAAILEAGGA